MPTFSTELFEIRVRQEFLGQELINLYYYTEADSGAAIPLLEVANEFNSEVQPDVEAIQVIEVVGIDIRVRKLGGVAETLLDISTQNGIRTGSPMASFNAWGFILNRQQIDVRNGAKRYGGLSEDDTQGNEPQAIIEVELGTLAAKLEATLDLDGGRQIKPMIFRRGSFVDPDWIGADVQSAQFTRLTSQVSRKDLLS